ncbi:MAG: signal peptidase II [Candidatus Nanopelagicales bacterium]
MLDRILRSPGPLRGAVVDYLAVKNFSIFNLADAFITIAAVFIVFLTVLKIDEKQR